MGSLAFRRLAVAVLAAGALVVVVGASADASGCRASRALCQSMFAAHQLDRAMRQLRTHVGRVTLVTLSITSTLATFTYFRHGQQTDYTATLPGVKRPHGSTIAIGLAPFAVSAVRTRVPLALITAIRHRAGLSRFATEAMDFGGRLPNTRMWTVYGTTKSRFLIFTASPRGRRLREVCSQPLPKDPRQRIGC